MFKQIDYCMVNVSDMHRSIEFYQNKLGLSLKFRSNFWTEFQTGATTLALHGGGSPAETPKGSGGQRKPVAGTCSIGFTVGNLDQTFAELKSKGVHFVMPPTDRPEEGIKLAVCLDPDGLDISFAEVKGKSPSPSGRG